MALTRRARGAHSRLYREIERRGWSHLTSGQRAAERRSAAVEPFVAAGLDRTTAYRLAYIVAVLGPEEDR